MNNLIEIDKIYAAKKQLNTAIKLFFNNYDSISIHTLCMAANQILVDISSEESLENTLTNNNVFNQLSKKLKYKIIYFARNFFKHAEKDSDNKIHFNSDINDYYLIDTILLFEKKTKKRTPETLTYLMWFINKYPTFLEHPENKNIYENIVNLQDESLKDFNLNDYKNYINYLHNNQNKELDYN